MRIPMTTVGGNCKAEEAASLLTNREWDVLQLMAEGRTNREISQLLHLSLETAKWHVSNILWKLGLCNRAQVAAWWYGLATAPQRAPLSPPQPLFASC